MMVVAPFVYDGLQARVAEDAGFPAVYCTGYGTAASHGLPDVGLLGLAEMAANGRRIAAAVGVPVICDADTGFGNAVNVARTVAEYAAAGIAGLHIEDQVWPKRCGFMAGKEVIPAAEATQKVRAAVEAAGPGGPVIIARTDALAPHGWDEVEARARAFAGVGAELIFVDGLRTRADAETCAARLGDLPLVYNGMLPVADMAALGFRLNLNSATPDGRLRRPTGHPPGAGHHRPGVDRGRRRPVRPAQHASRPPRRRGPTPALRPRLTAAGPAPYRRLPVTSNCVASGALSAASATQFELRRVSCAERAIRDAVRADQVSSMEQTRSVL